MVVRASREGIRGSQHTALGRGYNRRSSCAGVRVGVSCSQPPPPPLCCHRAPLIPSPPLALLSPSLPPAPLLLRYVHVIDDETTFDPGFGRKVLVGMLQLPPEDMHRRGRSEAVEVQADMAAKFIKRFDAFNWTKQLG